MRFVAVELWVWAELTPKLAAIRIAVKILAVRFMMVFWFWFPFIRTHIKCLPPPRNVLSRNLFDLAATGWLRNPVWTRKAVMALIDRY